MPEPNFLDLLDDDVNMTLEEIDAILASRKVGRPAIRDTPLSEENLPEREKKLIKCPNCGGALWQNYTNDPSQCLGCGFEDYKGWLPSARRRRTDERTAGA